MDVYPMVNILLVYNIFVATKVKSSYPYYPEGYPFEQCTEICTLLQGHCCFLQESSYYE